MYSDFIKVMNDQTINYRGCIISKVWTKGKVTGFSYNGAEYDTLIQAMTHIDRNLLIIANSVAK